MFSAVPSSKNPTTHSLFYEGRLMLSQGARSPCLLLASVRAIGGIGALWLEALAADRAWFGWQLAPGSGLRGIDGEPAFVATNDIFGNRAPRVGNNRSLAIATRFRRPPRPHAPPERLELLSAFGTNPKMRQATMALRRPRIEI
jgi:hypothetical protein